MPSRCLSRMFSTDGVGPNEMVLIWNLKESGGDLLQYHNLGIPPMHLRISLYPGSRKSVAANMSIYTHGGLCIIVTQP
jgi:hypothetical protein